MQESAKKQVQVIIKSDGDSSSRPQSVLTTLGAESSVAEWNQLHQDMLTGKTNNQLMLTNIGRWQPSWKTSLSIRVWQASTLQSISTVRVARPSDACFPQETESRRRHRWVYWWLTLSIDKLVSLVVPLRRIHHVTAATVLSWLRNAHTMSFKCTSNI